MAVARTSSTEAKAKRDNNRTMVPGGKEGIYIQYGMNAGAYVPVSLQIERGEMGIGVVLSSREQKPPTIELIEALYIGATTMRCHSGPCLPVSRNIGFHTMS